MLTQETIAYLLGLIALISTVFAVYNYFKTPQEKLERRDISMSLQLDSLCKDLANLRDNHLHTLESKLDTHIVNQTKSDMETAIRLAELTTMLNERLPVKKNN